MISNSYYTEKYFSDRDQLDLHIAETIRIFMQGKKLETVLDVGCGTGRLINYLTNQGFKVSGCDKSYYALKIAKRLNPNNKIFNCSVSKFSFKPNSFDLVTAISLIEHLTDLDMTQFIKEVRRVVRPNGFVFLVTPNYATPFRILQKKKWFAYHDQTHKIFYTPCSLTKILQQYKFKNINLFFKTNYDLFEWNCSGWFKYFPTNIKKLLTFLLTSTHLSFLRNSFWISGQK